MTAVQDAGTHRMRSSRARGGRGARPTC